MKFRRKLIKGKRCRNGNMFVISSSSRKYSIIISFSRTSLEMLFYKDFEKKKTPFNSPPEDDLLKIKCVLISRLTYSWTQSCEFDISFRNRIQTFHEHFCTAFPCWYLKKRQKLVFIWLLSWNASFFYTFHKTFIFGYFQKIIEVWKCGLKVFFLLFQIPIKNWRGVRIWALWLIFR